MQQVVYPQGQVQVGQTIQGSQEGQPLQFSVVSVEGVPHSQPLRMQQIDLHQSSQQYLQSLQQMPAVHGLAAPQVVQSGAEQQGNSMAPIASDEQATSNQRRTASTSQEEKRMRTQAKNRKAQQAYRQRQKVRKIEQQQELFQLQERIKQLEQEKKALQQQARPAPSDAPQKGEEVIDVGVNVTCQGQNNVWMSRSTIEGMDDSEFNELYKAYVCDLAQELIHRRPFPSPGQGEGRLGSLVSEIVLLVVSNVTSLSIASKINSKKHGDEFWTQTMEILGLTDKQTLAFYQAVEPYLRQQRELLAARSQVVPLIVPPEPGPRSPQLALSMSALKSLGESVGEEAKLLQELVNRCFLEVLQPHQTAQLLVCCYPNLLDGVGFAVHVAQVAEKLRLGGEGDGGTAGVKPEDDVIRSVQHMMGINSEAGARQGQGQEQVLPDSTVAGKAPQSTPGQVTSGYVTSAPMPLPGT